MTISLIPSSAVMAREALIHRAHRRGPGVHLRPQVRTRRFHSRRSRGRRRDCTERIDSNDWRIVRSTGGTRRSGRARRAPGEVAHLGEGDQPLVAPVPARDRAEEVRLGGGGKALEREVREPPEVHPGGHHRVHAAQVGVLVPAAVAAQEGRDVDLLRRVRERHATTVAGRSAASSSARGPRPADVEVGEHALVGGQLARLRGQRPKGGGEVVAVAERGRHVVAHPLVLVRGVDERHAVEQPLLDGLELPDPVVAPRHRLDQRAGVADMPADQRRERLRAGHERRHPLVAVARPDRRPAPQDGSPSSRRSPGAPPRRPARRSSASGARAPARPAPARASRARSRAGRARRAARRRRARPARAGARGSHARRRAPCRPAAVRGTGGGRPPRAPPSLEPADAVVGERALERRDEALGQALGGGVERAQEACRYSCGLRSSSSASPVACGRPSARTSAYSSSRRFSPSGSVGAPTTSTPVTS